MTQKLRDHLKDCVVVFDIDGVLASYEFGDLIHTADIWEEAFVSNDQNPYCQVGPLPVLQDFVRAMDPSRVFVCSVADDYEAAAKKAFVAKNYPQIPEDNIFLVEAKDQKLQVLRQLQSRFPDTDIAIVDDTVKTLDAIHHDSDFITVHITSFFD